MHVPFAPHQVTALGAAGAGKPAMSVRDMATGLAAMLEAAATTTTDIRETGGATH